MLLPNLKFKGQNAKFKVKIIKVSGVDLRFMINELRRREGFYSLSLS
jgi:hypothetical protein